MSVVFSNLWGLIYVAIQPPSIITAIGQRPSTLTVACCYSETRACSYLATACRGYLCIFYLCIFNALPDLAAFFSGPSQALTHSVQRLLAAGACLCVSCVGPAALCVGRSAASCGFPVWVLRPSVWVCPRAEARSVCGDEQKANARPAPAAG